MSIQGKCKWLLFIAIGHYPQLAASEQLPGVLSDAQRLYEVLCDYADGEIISSRWLWDEQATKTNILREIVGLRRANASAQVIVYFGGHGHRLNGVSCLLPHEAHWKSPLSELISFEELGAALKEIRAEEIVIIVDCCHSGGLIGLAADVAEDLSQQVKKGCIIAATRAQRISLEDNTGGVFLQALCEALTNPLLSNEYGQIAIQTAFDWVVQSIPERVEIMLRKLAESFEQRGQRAEATRILKDPAYRQTPVCLCRRDKAIYLTRVEPLIVRGDFSND
jgi:hypothetical protein